MSHLLLLNISSMADTEVPTCKDFHVAIICALSLEADVVEELFDYKWETSEILPEFEDGSKLTLGRIEKHLVVLVWIGGMGKTKAGLAAASMEKNFKSVKYVMVVGICGGVPFIKDYEKKCEILLGDVIISTAIHKYDEGKVTERQKYVANTPFIPNKKEVFGNFLDIVKSRRHKRAEHTQRLREECANNLLNLLKILTSKGYADVQYPGWKSDKLYQTNHLHKHYDSSKCGECAGGKEVCELVNTEPCESLGCGDQNIIPRERLKELDLNGRTSPEVFFGPIGSGDKVVRSGKYRDDLAKNERIIGIEMEGPGVCEVFDQVVVIKSVCDYADSHKSKEWQPHAAATAAACAKAFLKLHGKKITQWETKKDHKISGMKSIIFKDHAPKPQPASSNSKPQTDREDPPEVKEFTLRDEDDTPLRAQTHPKAYDGQHRPNPHAQYHGYPPPPEVYSPPLPGMYKPPPPGMYNFQNPQQYQDYRSNFPLYRQHIYYPVQNPFEPIGPMTPPTSPPTPHGNIGLNETPTSQEPSAQARELHSPPMLLPEPSPSTWKDAQEDLKEGERVFSTASKTVVVVDSATHKPLGVMSYSVREIAGPTTPAISTGTLAQAVSQTNTLPSISPEPVATKVGDSKV